MPKATIHDDLSKSMARLDEERTLELVQECLTGNVPPLTILDLCHEGMIEVGKLYDQGIYYVSALIMAGEIMCRVGELVLPFVEGKSKAFDAGTILLGTVEGDIHFIGKDIFKTLVQGYGFTVRDLGVDVPAGRFLAAIHELKPHIVGLSCLITAALRPMASTIEFLKENVPREIAPRAYIIGGHVNEAICRQMGADYSVVDAMAGVHLCQKIMADRPMGE
ncbi:MAG TPA: cobalamin-dependent protein [Syntrophorhabdales bacterium]|nr:cobalamin-dependent protein [Syntrophorhabdales bacterium]